MELEQPFPWNLEQDCGISLRISENLSRSYPRSVPHCQAEAHRLSCSDPCFRGKRTYEPRALLQQKTVRPEAHRNYRPEIHSDGQNKLYIRILIVHPFLLRSCGKSYPDSDFSKSRTML